MGTIQGPEVAEAIFFKLSSFQEARGVSGSLRSPALKQANRSEKSSVLQQNKRVWLFP